MKYSTIFTEMQDELFLKLGAQLHECTRSPSYKYMSVHDHPFINT